MSTRPGVAGVVLAAGGGRRMGRPKGLVTVGGVPLVTGACTALADGGCDPVGVVVGAAGEEVRPMVADPVAIVVNERWATGIASSLRSALRWAAGLRPAVAAVVLLPVDTPGIGPMVVRRVIAAWSGADPTHAVVATYGGRPRNPVLLPAAVWTDVAASVHGDTGARDWLRADPRRVIEVDCTDLGDPIDLDTPEDLANWTGRPDVTAAGPTGDPHGA
ncbi:MAG TPA: nucleotidyltransferase family protein [Euzebya sp.]|nr:nucleotidyltransferase family protein [Euzebya sp.]